MKFIGAEIKPMHILGTNVSIDGNVVYLKGATVGQGGGGSASEVANLKLAALDLFSHVAQQAQEMAADIKAEEVSNNFENPDLSTNFIKVSNEVNVPSQSGSTINSSNGYNPGGLSPENKKILCTAICKCEKSPNIGKTGNQLKQSCVSSALNQLDKILYNRSTIKPEINYDMTQTLSAPIMSRGNPLSGTEYLPNRVIDNPGFTPNSGMVRRPDVVIVKDQTQPPVQENIKNVVEIKFPGDSYTEKQQLAYEKIAGDPNKVSTLSPCDCDCDQNDKERKAAEDKAKQIGTALTLVEILLIILSGGKFVPSRGGVVPGLAPI